MTNGAVVSDRRADWQPAQEQHVERLGVPVGGGDDEAVARAEYDELAALDGPAFGSGGAVTGEPDERR